MATPKVTAALDELKDALSLMTVASGYNFTYVMVKRGKIDLETNNDFPAIEIRQLSTSDSLLANRTLLRSINVYIIISNNTGGGRTPEEKEEIVENMKQDVLTRIYEAYVDNPSELSSIELISVDSEDLAIEDSNLIQGGLAMSITIRHLYDSF